MFHTGRNLLPLRRLVLWLCLLGSLATGRSQGVAAVDVAGYPSLQAAIDANPGRILKLQPGEYEIAQALIVTRDGTELHGPARITQSDPHQPILLIKEAANVRIKELAFTRSPGRQDTDQPGIDVQKSRDIVLSQLRVSENHSHGSIRVMFSRDVTVENCVITNYKGLVIDDRTKDRLSGYAFQAIDGFGIEVRYVEGITIRDNRIQEFRLLPTREIRDQYGLGKITAVNEKPGILMKPEHLRTRYTSNWHQGSGILIASPKVDKLALVTGNFIENAAQGIDMHADVVTASNNIISHCMIGLKAVHGAKHVLLIGNQISHVDLWGILLQPGTASQASANAEGDKPAVEENVDGGSIIANNIISNFGFGEQYWNWAGHANFCALNLGAPPLPENPSLRNLLVTGNVVHDSGRDTVLVDGKWTKVPPRYDYAVRLELTKPNAVQNVHFTGNLFDPGAKGVSDYPLPD